MQIEYVTGDILDGPEEYVAQGCNSKAVMGSGLAKVIRDRFPKVYREYRRAYEDNGNFLELGDIIWVDVGPKVILNAITQENFGRDPNIVYVSYDAMQKVIQTINEELGDSENPPRVAFPLIGCGLANGSWKTVSGIIEEFSTDFQPVVYLLDGILPDN